MRESMQVKIDSETITLSVEVDCVTLVHRAWCPYEYRVITTATTLSKRAFFSMFSALLETVKEERGEG